MEESFIRTYVSQNYNKRPCDSRIDSCMNIDMLVIHYTDMLNAHAAIERLCDPDSQVSAHYLIDEEGQIFELVQPELRAWHAGISVFRNHCDLNNNSIGIELSNGGETYGYPPFSQQQITSLIRLCHFLCEKFSIAKTNIVGHSDIACARKKDPGIYFPWKWLARENLGILYEDFPYSDCIATLSHSLIKDALHKMQKIGYPVDTDTEPNSSSCNRCIIEAFQSHFRGDYVDGVIDYSTMMVLESISTNTK